jgi:hypothetical protein
MKFNSMDAMPPKMFFFKKIVIEKGSREPKTTPHYITGSNYKAYAIPYIY